MGRGRFGRNLFDFKDFIMFGMFILALLTFTYMICHRCSWHRKTTPKL